MCLIVLCLLVTLISPALSEYSPQTGCDPNDQKCLEILFNGIYYDIVRGIPDLGIEPLDPLPIDYIEASFATFNYYSTNCSVFGLKNINIQDILIIPDLGAISFTLKSPSLLFLATTTVNGYRQGNPVNGTGIGELDIGEETVVIYSKLNIVNGSDSDSYLQFGNYSLDVSLQGDYIENLSEVDSKQQLDNTFETLSAEDRKKQFFFVEYPLWNPVVAAVLQNFNKYFAAVPKSKLIACIQPYTGTTLQLYVRIR